MCPPGKRPLTTSGHTHGLCACQATECLIETLTWWPTCTTEKASGNRQGKLGHVAMGGRSAVDSRSLSPLAGAAALAPSSGITSKGPGHRQVSDSSLGPGFITAPHEGLLQAMSTPGILHTWSDPPPVTHPWGKKSCPGAAQAIEGPEES